MERKLMRRRIALALALVLSWTNAHAVTVVNGEQVGTAGGSQWTALGTANANSTPSITFTGLTAGTYPRYALECTGVGVASADSILVQILKSGTPQTTGYNTMYTGQTTSTSTPEGNTETTGWKISAGVSIDTTPSLSLTMFFPSLTTSGIHQPGVGWYTFNDGTSFHFGQVSGAYTADTLIANGFRITTAGGQNINNGVCMAFGLNP